VVYKTLHFITFTFFYAFNVFQNPKNVTLRLFALLHTFSRTVM